MAVFVAASALAKATGSQSLRAVSNRTYTINADAWYQRRKMHADYDAFWIERGGTPDDIGFKMPLEMVPRSQRTRRNEQRAQAATMVYRLFECQGVNRLGSTTSPRGGSARRAFRAKLGNTPLLQSNSAFVTIPWKVAKYEPTHLLWPDELFSVDAKLARGGDEYGHPIVS